MDEAKKKLWKYLKDSKLDGYKFYRDLRVPHPHWLIDGDFACPDRLLVFKIDGDEAKENWAQHQKQWEIEGYSVVWIPIDQIMNNIEGVLQIIRDRLKSANLTENG